MNSIWISINGFDNYMVSPEGNVLSKKAKYRKGAIVLKKCMESTGYLSVELYNGRKRKRFYIHRLVASCFCINETDKNVVNHINGDRHNNHYKNLEWVTAKENIHHAINKLKTINSIGENNPKAKLMAHDVEKIRALSLEGLSTKNISNTFKVSTSTINRIKSGKAWNK
jgi:hypothetical protein